MIYEWGRTIIYLCKSIRHFFGALFCKDYYVEEHGLGMCGKYGLNPLKARCCEYWNCPKRKGADDYERAIEQMEHDMLYEPTYNPEDGSM